MRDYTMSQHDIETLARRAGVSVEEYAHYKKMVKCVECGNWGEKGFQMEWVNRGNPPPFLWKCRYHSI